MQAVDGASTGRGVTAGRSIAWTVGVCVVSIAVAAVVGARSADPYHWSTADAFDHPVIYAMFAWLAIRKLTPGKLSVVVATGLTAAMMVALRMARDLAWDSGDGGVGLREAARTTLTSLRLPDFLGIPIGVTIPVMVAVATIVWVVWRQRTNQRASAVAGVLLGLAGAVVGVRTFSYTNDLLLATGIGGLAVLIVLTGLAAYRRDTLSRNAMTSGRVASWWPQLGSGW